MSFPPAPLPFVDLGTLTPDWLGLYVAEALSTDFGRSGRDICLVEVEGYDDRTPESFLAVSCEGIAMGEWDGPDDVEVEFMPWREVRTIGVNGTEVSVTVASDVVFSIDMGYHLPLLGNDDTASEDDDSEEVEKAIAAHARQVASHLIGLMRDAEQRVGR